MLFTDDYSLKMGVGEALMTAVVGICTVILILAIIALLIMLVSKIIRTIESRTGEKSPAAPLAAAADASVPLPDTESQGELVLENVDEPTAAVIMAIVSNKSGIPLNRLCFKSIKLLEDDKK